MRSCRTKPATQPGGERSSEPVEQCQHADSNCRQRPEDTAVYTGRGEDSNLIPGDVGRPIRDINFKVEIPNLEKTLLDVVELLGSKTIEVFDVAGQHYWCACGRTGPKTTRSMAW